MQVRISFFHAHVQISIGFRITPMPMPVGTNLNPYPCPSGFLSAGTRIFCALPSLDPSRTCCVTTVAGAGRQAQAQRLGLHASPSCHRGNPDDAAAAALLASSSLPGRALAYGGAQLMPLPPGLVQRARGPPPLSIWACSSPRCCRVVRQCLCSQKRKPNQRSLISMCNSMR